MGSRREEERNEKIIRGLMKLPPNRKCINCNSVGPQYVCTNFWTFICLSCSGIHREFTHRVKSVSMSKFATQEVRALEQGGNQRARDIYLKDWDWQRMRLPVNTNPDRIREFIRAVYVDKKYAGGSSNKPATDSESVKSNESELRRPNSYHSYSQSPPYDFQYEDRRYGKQVDTLARRPSDRALFDGKLGNFLFSPGRLRDQTNEDRFANESSGSRFSDFSASSTGDFRNDVLSPSSQETGYSSPSVHHSRNVSAENPQSQKHPNVTSQMDFNGVRRSQRTASSGSFGSFDGSSVSNKSVESGYPPDAPTEKSVHSAINDQTVASPVANSTQLYASPPNNHNLVSQKHADLGSKTTATGKPVQHGGARTEAVVSSPVPAQPTTFTPLDLFDQSSVQQPVTSDAPIDLFAGFNEQSSASHKAVNLGSHSDVAKEPAHNVVVQKAVVPSAESLATSHPVPQDLFSLSILQQPATSSPPPPIDLFADFDQQLPHVSSVQQIPSTAPLPANGGWAFFDAQHGSLTSFSNVQAQVPAAFPPSDGIAKGIDRSTLPTLPPNAIGSQSTPSMMDNWSLNAEEVKISVPKENSKNHSNNLFTFNTMSQVAPHQFTTPGASYVESRNPQDLARGETERPTPGDMFSGFNVSPVEMAGASFPAPLQSHLGGVVSHPGKSTNPFDIAFESDVDANDMFMDLTSLQETLPDPHTTPDYSGSLAQPWISQNSTMPYIPSGPQGGLSYVAGQDSHMLSSTQQGPFPPRNPFE
ncbi:putative ADP-ribosylation factor GTPase-activating protein AGD14 [Dichanthelium oligosanthes]|uniref:Putative ADP-ribosylation factor GTPase-activating protein AGD14 n=1 Tax=Dichanthelium oligosanthes TaxID=888268 RepID=A0A1E5WML3_9POAL|nr:putative ADP-ribosylation factor GTPase-activating protein AGD14 [Dichanthelium oligosanthes]